VYLAQLVQVEVPQGRKEFKEFKVQWVQQAQQVQRACST
jgi:hypothetical protein